MLLQVENIVKNFGGLTALNRVSFHVDSGEIVGLIGPNGSGKSTMFNVINGFLRVDSGRILFDGRNIVNRSSHYICRRGMGRTFQLVKPFKNLTVMQNMMAGCLYGSSNIWRKSDAEKRANEILDFIGLRDKAGSHVRDLTMMERKWIEVGRAVATHPKLLLLDEFMAGLNPTEVDTAVERVRKLRDMGITIIIVEHNVKVITRCSDRVVVLNAGQKISEGTPQQVIEDPEVIAAYLGKSYAKNH
jgi:branched-chain amino acid transport system ATP-binding protein